MYSEYGKKFEQDREQATDDAAADENRSWTPQDLTDVLDGTWQAPQPSVGARDDGVGLFYPGKKHTVSSESEAGKTWFILGAARDEIQLENHVVYTDFEDDRGPIIGRLKTLGLTNEQIREYFHYIRPESPIFLAPHTADIEGVLQQYRPTLAVIDGVTEAMTLHNLNPLDNFDVAKFGRMVPHRLAESGAATVSLDHVTKASEGRGRYSIGAVHKLNGLDGAAYTLDNRRPFGVGLKGVSYIRIAKDRPGELRKHAVPSSGGYWFADLILDTTIEGLSEGAIEIAAPVPRDPDAKPTILMKRVADAIEKSADGLTQTRLEDLVTGKAATIRVALSHLIADGYVTEKRPHKLIKPYDEGGENQ